MSVHILRYVKGTYVAVHIKSYTHIPLTLSGLSTAGGAGILIGVLLLILLFLS